MSPEPQKAMVTPGEVTEDRVSVDGKETQDLQQISEHPWPDDARVSDMAAVTGKVHEEPSPRKAHPPRMAAAEGDQSGKEPGTNETQGITTADANLRQNLEADSSHTMPVVAASVTVDKKKLDEQAVAGKKSSEDLAQKRSVLLETYDHMIDEEARIERRTGLPSERPSDKTRLVFLKKFMARADTALGDDEVLEETNIAEDMEVVRNAIGVPISALRSNSSKKPTSTKNKSTNPAAAAKRKHPSGNEGGPSKKKRPTQQEKNADTVSKYMFDQLAGKDMTATEKRDLKKPLPSLRGLTRARSAELKIIRAAAKKTKAEGTESWGRIDADIHAIIAMTKPFGNECKLTPLPGKYGIDEDERYVDDYGWEIEGMASTLRHHQLMAAGYMCIMERAGKYRGGLLFDYMGYGKTVESLALIVGNKEDQAERSTGDATTLVVVPKAAAQQWFEEVQLHCPGLGVSLWMKYCNMASLLKNDVLLITYSQVRTIYKEAGGTSKRGRKKEQQGDEEVDSMPTINHPLFNTNFQRIILDEIHEIKGYKFTYDAVMELEGRHKWGLTGTPTPNGIEELYPYLTFIGHPSVTTMQEFKNTYVGGEGRNAIKQEVRYERLRELLAPVMIMRKPSHSFLGSTLLKIPPGHLLPPTEVKLLAEEEIIYRSIKDKMQGHVMKKSAMKKSADEKGKMTKNLMYEALCRLRQCVSSPLLLRNLATEQFWGTDDIASMRREALDAGCQSTPFIDQIERWVLNSKGDHGRNPHGSVFPAKDISAALAVVYSGTCPGNSCTRSIAELIEPQMAECGHAWCQKCLVVQIKFEEFCGKAIPECSRCKKPLGQAKPISPGAGDDATEPRDQEGTPKRRLGEDYNGILPRGGRSPNIASLLGLDPNMKVPRSAKVDAVVRQIVAWQNEAPEDKIIVFIQWVDLNGILGRLLEDEGIQFLYYAGTAEMKEADRKAAIETFKEDPYVKVLNHEVEAQAMARVYRMGQKKETYFVRVTVVDSVDEDIYNLQESKLRKLQNAFQEFEAGKNLDKETLCKLLDWKTADDEPLGDEGLDSDEDDAPSDDSPPDDSDGSYVN